VARLPLQLGVSRLETAHRAVGTEVPPKRDFCALAPIN